RMVVLHPHAQRLRRLGALEPLELLEWRVRIGLEHAARAWCVEVERGIAHLLAERAQVRLGAPQWIARGRIARAPFRGYGGLQIAVLLLGGRERRAGARAAREIARLLDELGPLAVCGRQLECSAHRLEVRVV